MLYIYAAKTDDILRDVYDENAKIFKLGRQDLVWEYPDIRGLWVAECSY